jgi:hypothetical protein
MTDRYRYLSWPAYTVAIGLATMPIIDAVLLVWPPQFGVERWRFGAVGMLSNGLLLSNLGILVALATAMVRNHRRILKGIGYGSAIAAAIAVMVLVLFVIDSTHTRATVAPEQNLSYAVATVAAVGKQLLAVATLVAFAIAGFRSAAPARAASKAREGRNMLPLITEHA